MMYCPCLKASSLKASASFDLSYGSIEESNCTYVKNVSYFSLFLEAESLTMWVKVFLSRDQSNASESAIIVAALGALYNKASSPNESPAWYFFKKVGSFFPEKSLEQLRTPLSTTYR
jgi:hypothetical protein